MAWENIAGKKFGRLTAIESAETRNGRMFWRCKCECGNERIVLREHLTRGSTTSCGCARSFSYIADINYMSSQRECHERK